MNGKIGLISVYFPFFEDVMPANFRAGQEAFARRLRDALAGVLAGQGMEIVYPGLIDCEVSGGDAGRRFAKEAVDALLFAPTMAAPPSYTFSVLEWHAAPVVVWNPERVERFAPDLQEKEATRVSGLVGCAMVTNVLARRGHPFSTVSCAVDDRSVHRVVQRLRVAVAVNRFKRLRLLNMGEPIPGYLDIEVDREQLARLGPEVVDVDASELAQTYEGARATDAGALLDDLAANGWNVHPEIDADSLELGKSARLAVALEHLVQSHRADAGAVNCHGELFRRSVQVGIVACLGVSRLSSAGVPFACTGDLLTAIALKIGKELAGASHYCECYAMEAETGHFLIAAGGEGDPSFRQEGTPVTVRLNRHYPGKGGCGACISFRPQVGPATLINFTPAKDGWRLIWAEGEVVPGNFEGMVGPNGLFRFGHPDARRTIDSWCRAGATHHNALARGHIGDDLSDFSTMVGIEGVSIC